MDDARPGGGGPNHSIPSASYPLIWSKQPWSTGFYWVRDRYGASVASVHYFDEETGSAAISVSGSLALSPSEFGPEAMWCLIAAEAPAPGEPAGILAIDDVQGEQG